MKSDGNDGSALVSEGTPGPGSSRPPPRKRTSTLQGLAVSEDVPSLSPTADAPPSLEALDSAIGFTAAAARANHLAPPSAPPRPRQSGLPPAPTAASPASGLRDAASAPAGTASQPAPPKPTPSNDSVDGAETDDAQAGSALRDSASGAGATRRRSRRTLKIPNDAVPSTAQASSTPEPPAAPPAPAAVDASAASMPAPTSTPPMSAPTPPMERGPIVTDDSIAIIRPIPIIAIGEPSPAPPPAPPVERAAEPEPAAPSPPAVVAAPATPDLTGLPSDLETTLPSAPSPYEQETAAAPTVTAGSPEIHADEVDAIEEIEPERESGPPSDENALPRKAAKPDDDSLEEIEAADDADDIEPDQISGDELSRTDEIPIVMEVEPEQPKRPPPPKKPAGAPVSAPPSSPPAPASKPAPASRPAPPSSKAESKRRPWWEDVFSEDLLRTMDQPRRSFVQREVNFIEESLGVEKGAIVLDLACGTGVHAVELASRGYSVVGFDLSLAMLARAADEAQERGQKLNFLQGDMREMAFEEMFDGIYCWSTSFGYFDEEKNLDVLARAHRALRHGGMLLIDIINRDFVAPRQPSLVWFEGDGCVCMDEMQVDFFTSRLKVKRTVMFEDGRTREIDYSIRLYNLHEIGKMMHDCGFRVVQVTGHPAHPGVFFGSESPRIIVLAERAD